MRLFAECGYAPTTVDDIARAAGVTKPMIYRHFESKQDLCIALLERAREALIAASLARFTPGIEAHDQLRPMIEAWLAHVGEHPHATRLLFTPIAGDPEVARVQAELYGRQRDTQLALIREFAPDIDDALAPPLAEALRASLSAVALWWLDHPDVPREVPADALLRVAKGALAISPR